MSYGIKYQSEFGSVRGEACQVDILELDYAGAVTVIKTTIDQPVLIQREGEGRTWGLFGTACRVRFLNDGSFDPTDFVVNDFTELKAKVYKAGNLIFEGFIAVEDITHEYRVEPYAVELTFSDNISLLSDVEFPFAIDDGFTTLREVFQAALAQTNLELDLRVFFMPKAEDNDLFNRSFEQVKIVPRSYMENLTTFKKTKDVVNFLLTSLRCRLYQLAGAWVIQRTSDYLYNGSDDYTGARYTFGTGDYTADELTCDLVTDLIPLSFSQTVTHKRPLVKVQDSFKIQQLPGIWNADLQELGSLASTATVGNVRTDKYNFPFWTKIGAGYANTYIVVLTDTTTELEFDRYLEIPLVSENTGTANGILLNPILVSQGDKLNVKASLRSNTDTNFATYFSVAVILIGQSSQNYLCRPIFLGSENIWEFTSDDETTVETISNGKGLRGGDDLTQPQSWSLALEASSGIGYGIDPMPEDGILYIKIGGFKDNRSNSVPKICWLKDLEYTSIFFVNESNLVEGQKHTATSAIESLNIDEKEIQADDCVKYSAAGAFYDKDDANTGKWLRYDGDATPASLGQLNTTEQLSQAGEGLRVIGGTFEGAFDFNQFASFDSARFLPTRLAIDLHRQQIDAEFVELMAADDLTYSFKYLYKSTR